MIKDSIGTDWANENLFQKNQGKSINIEVSINYILKKQYRNCCEDIYNKFK